MCLSYEITFRHHRWLNMINVTVLLYLVVCYPNQDCKIYVGNECRLSWQRYLIIRIKLEFDFSQKIPHLVETGIANKYNKIKIIIL